MSAGSTLSPARICRPCSSISAQQLRDAAHVGVVERRLVGADEVVLEVGHQHPGGAEDRRLARDEQHRDLELGRDRGGVHGPGAAGDDQREVARVEPAADAHLADAGRHRDVDDVVDAGRRLDDSDAERPGEAALDRLLGGRAVEPHLAAEEGRLVDEAEHEVGVGDGRLRAAAAVAGGPGRGARALRADAQQPAVVDARDRAAAGADRVDVDRRQREPPAVDDRVGHHERRAVLHERGVEAGAAHVDRQAVVLAVRRQMPEAGGRARGRAREQRERGALGHLGGRRDAAVRLHHQQHAAEAEVVEAAHERLQVTGDDRPHVRVEDGRRRSVVVAHLREQVARRRHVRVRHQLAAELERATLVRGAGRRVQERDRDRLDAVGEQAPAGLAHALLVERCDLVALVVGALGDAEAQVARDERLGRLQAVVVRRLARALAQGERVAEALGAEEARGRAAAGQERVRGDGRAVHDQLDLGQELGERAPGADRDLLEAGDEAERRVAGGRARLVDEPRPVGAEHEEVGERPADVDADAVAHAAAAVPSRPRRAAAVGEDRDAVARPRLLGREQPVAHLLPDLLRVAAARVAVAAAAAVAAPRRSCPRGCRRRSPSSPSPSPCRRGSGAGAR